MTDDKATPPFVLRKKSPEELERIRTEHEARHAEQQDAIRAAADEFMRPMAERARETMDAALAVHRLTMPDLSEIARQATPNLPEMWRQMQRATMPGLSEMMQCATIPDELRMTPEERELKELERRLNESLESSRRNDELLRRRIQDDRARFIRDMAEANAAAIVQAQGKSEPVQAGKAEPATLPQDGDRPPQTSHTQARAVELAAVLDTIEARARECGVPLVRSQWPGTKAEFRGFLKWYAPRLLWALPTDNDNLTDELRPHGVAFGKPGRARDKGKKIYQELFPDYPA